MFKFSLYDKVEITNYYIGGKSAFGVILGIELLQSTGVCGHRCLDNVIEEYKTIKYKVGLLNYEGTFVEYKWFVPEWNLEPFNKEMKLIEQLNRINIDDL